MNRGPLHRSNLTAAAVAGLALLAPLARAADPPVSPPATAFQPLDTLPRNATRHFNFVTLLVADFDRSFAFYTSVLGMHERGRAQPSPRSFEVVVGYDDDPLGTGISLTYRDGASKLPANGASSINLVVTDLAALLTRVVPAGGRIAQPLSHADTPQASYSIAHIEDPDGNALELVEYQRIAK